VTLEKLAARLAAGELGAVEVFEATLSRIESTQGSLNAFRLVCADAAREQAIDADRRLRAGERLPLLGVPVPVKDDVDLAGAPTSFGCAGDFAPKAADSAVAARLRAAGAVIVGKTNSPEIGLWPFTEGSAFGATRNPWSLEHTPGGSSGGAAAAVAGGLVEAAIGSDGAGSVRIPAAWTNLVGVKPQRGRISTWPDPEAFNGLTVIGPLARTVGDAALLLDALTGNVDGDIHRPPPEPEPFADAARRAPGRLRIALALNVPYSGAPAVLDPEIAGAVQRLAAVLAGLGHDVEEVEVPYGLALGLGFMPRSMTGVRDWVARCPDPSQLDRRVRDVARLGGALRPMLPAARSAERRAQLRLGRVFERFDAILTPTSAEPPLPIGSCEGLGGWATDRRIVAACPYAWPWNVLGWPGINVPAGMTETGLPIGAQLLGPASSEGRLLSLAGQLEEAERWHDRRPPSASAAALA
jgi:amidase